MKSVGIVRKRESRSLKNRKEKAITLIALVITIIVILILAGVTVATLTGENGLLAKTQLAKEKNDEATDDEKDKLNSYQNEIDNYIAGNRNAKESSIIKNFTPQFIGENGNSIKIQANAQTSNDSEIKVYVYMLNGKVVDGNSSNVYTYCNLNRGTEYNIQIIAIDANGDFKLSDTITKKTSEKLKTRYAIVEVYDHAASNGAVINELELYNGENKLAYNIGKAYESLTKGVPVHWNGFSNGPTNDFWSKDNLFDGKIDYNSNAVGRVNTTLFCYETGGNTEHYARFIIDLGSEKDITNIRIAIGNNEDRIPKSVSVYTVLTEDYKDENIEDSTYYKNLMFRSNNNLTLIHKEEFSEQIKTPMWYNFL